MTEALAPPHNRVGGTGGGSPEWYTPAEIVADVRKVLGGIDLDPASCLKANRLVRATRYYTSADDGLAQPWEGRVYLNPPYGSTLPWVQKFFASTLTGCLTLPTSVDARAGQMALARADAVCFYAGRINYVAGPGAVQRDGGNAVPTMLLYRGPDLSRFAEVFGRRGVVMVPCMAPPK